MKKYLLALIVILSVIAMPVASLAQTVSSSNADIDPNGAVSNCVTLTSTNLRYRSNDAQTGGDVSSLQTYLQVAGYLSSDPTGYFGLLTLNAVEAFQTANGISPTGYVGSLTQAKIDSLSCNLAIAAPTTISDVNPPVVTSTTVVNTPAGTSNSPVSRSPIVSPRPYVATPTATNAPTAAPISTLTSSAFIKVLTPNGGEEWPAGSNAQFTIAWTYQNIEATQQATIYLQFPDGSMCAMGTSPVSGKLFWTIPESQGCAGQPTKKITTGQYKVVIVVGNDQLNPVAKDSSDGFFTITMPQITTTTTTTTTVASTPSITASGINSGEVINAGQAINFTYSITPASNYDVAYILVPDNGTAAKTGNGSYYDPSLGGYSMGGNSFNGAIGTFAPTGGLYIPSDIPSGSYHLLFYVMQHGTLVSGITSKSLTLAAAITNSFKVIGQTTITTITTTPTVVTPPLAVSCSGSPYNSGVPGMSWGSNVTGGVAPYQYSWSMYNDVSNYGEGSGTSPSWSVSYSSVGTKSAVLRVTDSIGNTAQTSCSGSIAAIAQQAAPTSTTLTISGGTQNAATVASGPIQGSATTFSLSQTSITLGQSVTLTSRTNSPSSTLENAAIDQSSDNANWNSGAPCGYWTNSGSDNTVHTISCSYTPTAAGTYYFRSRGQDSVALSPFVYQTLVVTQAAQAAANTSAASSGSASTANLTNGISYITVPATVTIGQTFSVTVQNSGTKPWGSNHYVTLYTGDAVTGLAFDPVSGVQPGGQTTVTFTAPSTPGTYIIRGMEQNVEYFGQAQTITVVSAGSAAVATAPAAGEITTSMINDIINVLTNLEKSVANLKN